MKTIEIKIYTFDELSEAAKQVAIDNYRYANVENDWWNDTYEDAKTIGLKLNGFGLERDLHAEGEFIESAERVADLIIKNHGDTCDTYKTAKTFIEGRDALVEKYSDGVKKDTITEENEDDFDGECDELKEEFLKDLLSDYADILQKECDYQTSDEAVKETILANEYTFTEDGKRWPR